MEWISRSKVAGRSKVQPASWEVLLRAGAGAGAGAMGSAAGATKAELTEALRGALGRSGALDEVRAQVRAEVLRAFAPGPADGNAVGAAHLAGRTPEERLVEDLVREWLEWNGYQQ